MKQFLLMVTFAGWVGGFAQSYTITQSANEPVAGDTRVSLLQDTTSYTTGLPRDGGSDQTWDFSKLKLFPGNIESQYRTPSSAPSASVFPSATVIENDAALITAYKSSASPAQLELLGLLSPVFSLTLSNPGIVMKYPFSFGNSISDGVSGNVSITGTPVPCSGTVTTNADATGTLLLPGGGSLSNVLRVKSVQTLRALWGGFLEVGSLKQTIFAYYHQSQKFPVLTVSYSEIKVATGSPTVAAVVLGNNSIFAGTAETPIADAVKVYPNPAMYVINIATANRTSAVSITATDGTLVMEADSDAVNIEALPAGLYFLNFKVPEGTVRKKFLKL